MAGNGLRDKVVVVTGASGGIGRAAALAFARRRARVVLAARRGEALDEVERQCQGMGAEAMAATLDVTEAEAVEDLASRAVQRFGQLDVWINNAAVSMFARLEEAPLDVYRRVVETNLLGTVHGARAAIPWFREQGHGVLINNSSVLGRVGAPYLSAYVMTKWAIRGLGETLRQELLDAPDVHVCTILPASIDTPIFQQAANYTGRETKPLEPIYPAERVAEAMVKLAMRPRAEKIVGTAGKPLPLRFLFPGLIERAMAKGVEEDHFQRLPTPPRRGNVFEPDPEWARIDGGWRENGEGSSGARLILIPLAGAAVAGGALAARRQARRRRSLPERLRRRFR
jgi:NAD(P)-dependent dehydrogenase (short-subunit alcohol dehydrogenase family)